MLAWLAIALGLWIGVRACGAQIPFGAMLIILPATALGIALPTPGGLGGFNVALATGLQIFLALLVITLPFSVPGEPWLQIAHLSASAISERLTQTSMSVIVRPSHCSTLRYNHLWNRL